MMINPLDTYSLDDVAELLGYSKSSIKKRIENAGGNPIETKECYKNGKPIYKISGYDLIKLYDEGIKEKEELSTCDNIKQLENVLRNKQLVVNAIKKKIKSLQ